MYTGVGTFESEVELVPSAPQAPSPQQYALLSDKIAQLWLCPSLPIGRLFVYRPLFCTPTRKRKSAPGFDNVVSVLVLASGVPGLAEFDG